MKWIYLTLSIALATASCTETKQASNEATGSNIVVSNSANAFVGTAAGITPDEMTAALGSEADQSARDAIIDKLPTATINDGGTPRTRIVWEGDILLSRDQLNAILKTDEAVTKGVGLQPELKIALDDHGRPAFWPKGQRDLTYVVNRRSFPSAGQADQAVGAMAQAASDWSKACPECGLTMREVASGNATFRVEYNPNPASYIAAAFFPYDPAWMRVLYIRSPFYTMRETKTGVLRHELGHVLGYRHEHISGIPGCKYENDRWLALTPYDSVSVMHYPCGGGGTLQMALSPDDIEGHKRQYSR